MTTTTPLVTSGSPALKIVTRNTINRVAREMTIPYGGMHSPPADNLLEALTRAAETTFKIDKQYGLTRFDGIEIFHIIINATIAILRALRRDPTGTLDGMTLDDLDQTNGNDINRIHDILTQATWLL